MTTVIGHLLRAADFERVLGTPTRARSVHFAVHYLAATPSRPSAPTRKADLSTGPAPAVLDVVDGPAPAGLWVGTVVPKRHARRAVTRTLLKRQIHRAVRDQLASTPDAGQLPHGLWVVRLRVGFDRKLFASASSEALRQAAADELDALMAQAARRARS